MASRAGDFIFIGGGIAAHPASGVPDEVKPMLGYPYHWSGIHRQLRYIYDQMRPALDDLGSGIQRMMKVNTYLIDPREIYEALNIRKDYFGVETPPPSTLVLVPELPVKGVSVATDGVALAQDAELDREALFTSTPEAPMPPHERIWGHRIYVKASRGGGFIFTSGRTNNVIGAASDKMSVGHPDFPYRDDQSVIATEMILRYLKSALSELGAGLQDVVKAEVHLSHMKNLAGLDEVWPKHFGQDPPARIFVPAHFPNEFAVFEIELIALDPRGPYQKEIVSVRDVPQPLGYEPRAVKAGPYLFFSGQMATDYRQGLAPEASVDPHFPFHASRIKKQVRYILKNVEAICRACGTSSQNLVRRRALHVDLNDLGEAETVWNETIGPRLPPTTVFRTAGPLPVPECSVQYDLTAFIP